LKVGSPVQKAMFFEIESNVMKGLIQPPDRFN